MTKRLFLIKGYNGELALDYITTGKCGRPTKTGDAELNLAIGGRHQAWYAVDCIPKQDIYNLIKDELAR